MGSTYALSFSDEFLLWVSLAFAIDSVHHNYSRYLPKEAFIDCAKGPSPGYKAPHDLHPYSASSNF